MENLTNKRVAILATDGFEESELREPLNSLKEAGAKVDIVSDKSGSIKSWNDGDWGKEYEVDRTLTDVNQDDYNALVLPGGVINPDKLRTNDKAVSFTRSFFENKKPVAAICHGPQILAEADVLENRNITSYESIKTDMINAGANWTNESVVVDEGLVTSRSPEDLNDFCSKLIEEVKEGKHEEQTV